MAVVAMLMLVSIISVGPAQANTVLVYDSYIEHGFVFTGFHTMNSNSEWWYVNMGSSYTGHFRLNGYGSSNFAISPDQLFNLGLEKVGPDYFVPLHMTGNILGELSFSYEHESDLSFGSVTLTAQVLINGMETTVISETRDRAMLLSTPPENNRLFFYFGSSFDFGTVLVPITLEPAEGDWVILAYSFDYSWPILFTINENKVPLPPTLLLFGSGLLGLAGRRRFRMA
ncbi:MAG: PEP-CTERM sorting domain-containing protein [Desulfobaccales bacterium]